MLSKQRLLFNVYAHSVFWHCMLVESCPYLGMKCHLCPNMGKVFSRVLYELRTWDTDSSQHLWNILRHLVTKRTTLLKRLISECEGFVAMSLYLKHFLILYYMESGCSTMLILIYNSVAVETSVFYTELCALLSTFLVDKTWK